MEEEMDRKLFLLDEDGDGRVFVCKEGGNVGWLMCVSVYIQVVTTI